MIGSGPNGLAAAILFASAGQDTTVSGMFQPGDYCAGCVSNRGELAEMAPLVVIQQLAKSRQGFLCVELPERLDRDHSNVGTLVIERLHQASNRRFSSDLSQRPCHFVIHLFIL